MAFKHYDVVRAASPSDLAERITQKLKEGWQPYGSALISTAGYGAEFIQPVVSEGELPSLAESGNHPHVSAKPEAAPEYYYVIALAGQSNSMSYGEGLPLPETYDRPDPRIKQLARRSTVTPGGAACKYNDIIPADHCLHDVQDMSRLNHPKADLSKGQYGTVGQGLHIAKKLLPFIPANAGILLVPCCRGGSAFTTGADGTYSDAGGASENSTRWGVDKPLYKDLIGRTKAALKKNPKNVLFAVVWMQGEFDFGGTPVNHAAQFGALVDKFRADLADMAGQCVGGSAGGVPWICGDTTYFWKQKNESTYQTVYGSYKNKTEKNIHFVPFMTDENGVNVPTNKPEEDPDIPGIGYYGSKWRDSSATWTSQDRASHFSSWARRGIISDRLATAILRHAGRVALNAGASSTVSEVRPSSPSGAEVTGVTTLLSYLASESEGSLKVQGWSASGGRAEVVSDAEGTGGKAVKVTKEAGKSTWVLEYAAGNGAALLQKGGQIRCRFKASGALAANQYVMAFYWPVSSLPQGVVLTGDGGNNLLAAFYIQTDAKDLNVMYHNAKVATNNLKLGSFGAFDNEWHTLAFRFAGNNSLQVTPVIDGQDGTPFTLTQSPVSAFSADKLHVTDITKSATYPVLIDSIAVEVNNADAAA
ncbi:SASA family carbohydrate esterase [Escherichia coli]|uniref:SASA family carbohydrate esterase n=1 Tax=Escherichia coli TaxID=562 RepID=UPI001076919D|nr:SASA family carbohydrate esterase [Escherichia coli]TFY18174.1 sialate O-acetylesterase [Escherichia coli]